MDAGDLHVVVLLGAIATPIAVLRVAHRKRPTIARFGRAMALGLLPLAGLPAGGEPSGAAAPSRSLGPSASLRR